MHLNLRIITSWPEYSRLRQDLRTGRGRLVETADIAVRELFCPPAVLLPLSDLLFITVRCRW